MVLAFLNGLALTLYEVGIKRGLEWLRGRWFRGLLFAGFLVSLSIPTVDLIIDPENIERVTILASIAWGVAIAAGYASYRYEIHDMIPLALVISNISLILLIFIGKILFREGRGEMAWLFLVFSLIVLAVVSGAVFFLRRTAAAMAKKMVKAEDE
jgi:hypothetical protein